MSVKIAVNWIQIPVHTNQRRVLIKLAAILERRTALDQPATEALCWLSTLAYKNANVLITAIRIIFSVLNKNQTKLRLALMLACRVVCH